MIRLARLVPFAVAIVALSACQATDSADSAGGGGAGPPSGTENLGAILGEPSAAPTTGTPGDGQATSSARTTVPPRGAAAQRVVVLDPGHNGGNAAHTEIIDKLVPDGQGQLKPCNTAGAETNDGYAEHTFNFDVAQRVRALLTDAGVQVRLTRPDDTGVGPCVDARARYANATHADAVVSIHADGSLDGHGFHVIEAAKPPAGADMAAASHRLATAVHDSYLGSSAFQPATYIGTDGYDQRTDLAGLNLSTQPTIFIECGNMRDRTDATRMEDPDGRQRVAQGIALGILAYLGQH